MPNVNTSRFKSARSPERERERPREIGNFEISLCGFESIALGSINADCVARAIDYAGTFIYRDACLFYSRPISNGGL